MSTTEELKAIVAAAPEGAEYVDSELAEDGKTMLTRSLSDIETIIRLQVALESALEACYELDEYGVRELNENYLKAILVLAKGESK